MNLWTSHLPRASSLGASLLALLAACATPPPRSVDAAPEYDRSPTYPYWAGQPATWAKMGEIEDWLAGSGPRQYPAQVHTAELELAEGRLALTQRERDLSPTVVTARLKAAERGFSDLLGASDLKPSERARAEKGLAEIAKLRGKTEPARTAKAEPRPAAPGAVDLTVLPRSAWRAASPVTRRLDVVGGRWSRITIHHSAKYSHEIGAPTEANVAAAIKLIQTVHMRDEGYGDIGYHFLIDPAGRVWQGRSLEWQGAHAGGADGINNVGNIGICVLGDFNSELPDPRALRALETLVDDLCADNRIPRARVYGHRELRNTECPGDALMSWVKHYAAGAQSEREPREARAPRAQSRTSASAPTAVQ